MAGTERLWAGWTVLGLLALLPWLTWMPLTSRDSYIAVVQTPHWLFACGGLLLVALWIGTVDWWLGVLLGYVALRAVPLSYPTTFEAAYVMVFGGLMLVAARTLAPYRVLLLPVLLAGGVLQVLYGLQQWAGYDLIWMGLQYGPARVLGTLGQENFVGAYLGLLLPVAPLWLAPAFVLGLFLTKSMTGMLAGMVGLLWQQRAPWWAWTMAGAGVVWMLLTIAHGPVSLVVRMRVWAVALAHQTWSTWLVGHGLGAWPMEFPMMQPWQGIGEFYLQAHNEYVQFGYEAGLLGLVLAGGWLWTHRAGFRGPWGGSLVAVLLVSAAMFPFHLAIVGLLAVTIMGLATAPEKETV